MTTVTPDMLKYWQLYGIRPHLTPSSGEKGDRPVTADPVGPKLSNRDLQEIHKKRPFLGLNSSTRVLYGDDRPTSAKGKNTRQRRKTRQRKHTRQRRKTRQRRSTRQRRKN